MPAYGWSLDRALWERLGKLCEGRKWSKVHFDESKSSLIPARPGVYLIVAGPPCVSDTPHCKFMSPLYAGQSKTSIRSRFVHHLDSPDARVALLKHLRTNATVWFYCTVTNIDEVDELESLLIDCYGPPANSQRGIQARLRDPVPAG